MFKRVFKDSMGNQVFDYVGREKPYYEVPVWAATKEEVQLAKEDFYGPTGYPELGQRKQILRTWVDKGVFDHYFTENERDKIFKTGYLPGGFSTFHLAPLNIGGDACDSSNVHVIPHYFNHYLTSYFNVYTLWCHLKRIRQLGPGEDGHKILVRFPKLPVALKWADIEFATRLRRGTDQKTRVVRDEIERKYLKKTPDQYYPPYDPRCPGYISGHSHLTAGCIYVQLASCLQKQNGGG